MTTDIQQVVIKAIGEAAWVFVREYMKARGLFLEGELQADGTFEGVIHTPMADIKLSGAVIPKAKAKG